MSKKPRPSKRNKWILFLMSLIVVALFTITVKAQYSYKRPKVQSHHGYATPGFFVGVEAVTGVRTFTVSSNIKQFDEVRAIGQGQSLGFVAGGYGVLVKVRHGNYNSTHSDTKEIGIRQTTVAINASPLQLIQKRQHHFEPYTIFDIDLNNVDLYGTSLPVKLSKEPKKKEETCHEGLPGDPDHGSGSGQPDAPPANPQQPAADPDTPVTNTESGKVFLATIKAVRASTGIGLVANISNKKTFTKIFTEAVYGWSFKTTSTHLDFRETKVSGQYTVNFGIIMGINTNKIGRR